jgi:hypothetical protein
LIENCIKVITITKKKKIVRFRRMSELKEKEEE